MDSLEVQHNREAEFSIEGLNKADNEGELVAKEISEKVEHLKDKSIDNPVSIDYNDRKLSNDDFENHNEKTHNDTCNDCGQCGHVFLWTLAWEIICTGNKKSFDINV